MSFKCLLIAYYGRRRVKQPFKLLGSGLHFYQENRMKEKGKKIVMDPKAALRKGLNIIKDCR